MSEEGLDVAFIAQAELIEERTGEALGETAGLEEFVVEVVGAVDGELGGLAETLFAHDTHVDGDPKGHERLVGADIRRGFLAADMLLAGLQGEDEGASALGVDGLSDDAAGHLTHEFVGGAHVAKVGSAEAHGHAEALGLAHGDVGAPLAGCLEQGEVGCDAVDDEQCFLGVALVGHAGEVLDDAVAVGLLYDDAGDATFGEHLGEVGATGGALVLGNLLEAEAVDVGVGADDGCGARVDGGGDEHAVSLMRRVDGHHRGFGGGGGAVVHRGVADVHAGERGHHRLVFEDVVEGALGDLSLVGRVAREELGALDEGGDDGGDVVVVDACAREADEGLVLCSETAHPLAQLYLALGRRQGVVALEAQLSGDVGVEVVDGLHTDSLEHGVDVGGGMGEIFEHGDGVYGENGVDGVDGAAHYNARHRTEGEQGGAQRGEQGEARRQQAGGAGRGKRGQAERGLYFSQYFW